MPDEKTCAQCGRRGTRGFRTYPGDPARGIPTLTMCTAQKACRNRWPRQRQDDD